MKTLSRRNADDPVAAGNDGHGLANGGGIAIDQRGAQIDDGVGRVVGSGGRRRCERRQRRQKKSDDGKVAHPVGTAW
jgi:hypothetical protein